MQGHLFTHSVHLHGTLAANAEGRFKLPVAAILKEVQFSCSSATAATIDFGTAADPDGYGDDLAIGQSNNVATFDNDDWNGALYNAIDPAGSNIENIYIPEDTILRWTITHASAQNVTLVFVFIE